MTTELIIEPSRSLLVINAANYETTSLKFSKQTIYGVETIKTRPQLMSWYSRLKKIRRKWAKPERSVEQATPTSFFSPHEVQRFFNVCQCWYQQVENVSLFSCSFRTSSQMIWVWTPWGGLVKISHAAQKETKLYDSTLNEIKVAQNIVGVIELNATLDGNQQDRKLLILILINLNCIIITCFLLP